LFYRAYMKHMEMKSKCATRKAQKQANKEKSPPNHPIWAKN
jgi:hypothetical protein